jgi:hypothetical protein
MVWCESVPESASASAQEPVLVPGRALELELEPERVPERERERLESREAFARKGATCTAIDLSNG